MTCHNCGLNAALVGDTWCAKCIHDYDEFEDLNDRYADWGGMGSFDDWQDEYI